jgi:hypothetical protein
MPLAFKYEVSINNNLLLLYAILLRAFFIRKNYKLEKYFIIMDKKTFGLIRFIGGVIFCLSSAILMFSGNQDIPVPIKISLLVVGIALIATSKFRLLK